VISQLVKWTFARWLSRHGNCLFICFLLTYGIACYNVCIGSYLRRGMAWQFFSLHAHNVAICQVMNLIYRLYMGSWYTGNFTLSAVWCLVCLKLAFGQCLLVNWILLVLLVECQAMLCIGFILEAVSVIICSAKFMVLWFSNVCGSVWVLVRSSLTTVVF